MLYITEFECGYAYAIFDSPICRALCFVWGEGGASELCSASGYHIILTSTPSSLPKELSDPNLPPPHVQICINATRTVCDVLFFLPSRSLAQEHRARLDATQQGTQLRREVDHNRGVAEAAQAHVLTQEKQMQGVQGQ